MPVKEFVAWLAGLGCSLVIEFPTREDPMVKKLLAPSATASTPTTSSASSSACLGEAFEIERSERLQSGTRRALLRAAEGG